MESLRSSAGGSPYRRSEVPTDANYEQPAGSSILGVLAFFVVWLGSLFHLLGPPTWRSDRAALSVLADYRVLAGSVSASLARLAEALPLGSRSIRTALLSALCLGLSALLISKLTLLSTDRSQRSRRSVHWLAFAAAVTVCFSGLWVSEGTVIGGATVGAMLVLWGLVLLLERPSLDRASTALQFGVVMGTVVAESPWGAVALSLASCAAWPLPRSLRHAGIAVGVALGTIAVFWAPALFSLTAAQLRALPLLSEHAGFPAYGALDWLGRAGLFWAVGAGFGLFLPAGDRRPWLCLGVCVLLDWAVPGREPALWTQQADADPSRTVLHMVAVAVVAPLGVAGFSTALEWARKWELFGARQMAALFSTLGVAASIATIEDAHRSLRHTNTSATAQFTDSALAPLLPGAVVLTDSPEMSQRLLAAQSRGYRPDVLIVPLQSLAEARRVRGWLEAEPALETLIRDLSVRSSPSERGLDLLCRARPLYVEPDPAWDRRLLEHLRPGFPLSKFETHAIGNSDRQMALSSEAHEVAALGDAAREGLVQDRATQAVLADQTSRLRRVLERIGDASALKTLDEAIAKSASDDDPRSAALHRRRLAKQAPDES